MPIPDYQSIFLPLLKLASNGEEHALRSAVDRLADRFGLDESERKELLPSGQQEIFTNRVGWASTYLKKAGLLESTRRGYFRITDRGRKVLGTEPAAIDNEFLNRFPEFVAFRTRRTKPKTQGTAKPIDGDDDDATPEELIEASHQKLRDDLADEIIQQILDCTPAFFERLVVDLLVRMGYGGSRKDAGQAIGRSGDEGIDGIIKEDRLGLDVIYLQAKRWQGPVGRPEIQKFVGALHGQRARKGIMITTSSFTADAVSYAGNIENKVVLIDGEDLAKFMIDSGVGVSTVASYEIKRIDSDYFLDG
jgi:restriction system protein